MSLTLPSRPAQYFIDEVLLPEWQPSDALGYEVQNVQPSDATFLPVATSIDNVGATYPSLVVQYSNETSGGESTYSFMTSDGPGQNRAGTLLATARAQDREGDYVGDSNTYTAQTADDVVVTLIEAVEAVCQRQAHAPSTDFATIGSQRGPDAPDDMDEDPPVRLAQCQIDYSWVRHP